MDVKVWVLKYRLPQGTGRTVATSKPGGRRCGHRCGYFLGCAAPGCHSSLCVYLHPAACDLLLCMSPRAVVYVATGMNAMPVPVCLHCPTCPTQ